MNEGKVNLDILQDLYGTCLQRDYQKNTFISLHAVIFNMQES